MNTTTEQIREQYRLLDQKLAAFSYELNSRKEFEAQIFCPRKERQAELTETLAQLKGQVQELPVPEPQFDVVKGHLEDFAEGLAGQIQSMYRDPGQALGAILWREDALRRDHRDLETRKQLLIHIWKQLPDVWDAIRGWIDELTVDAQQSTRATLLAGADELRVGSWEQEQARKSPNPLFAEPSWGNQPDLEECREQTAQLLEQYAEELGDRLHAAGEQKDVLPDEVRTIQMPEKEYKALLWNNLGVKLSELLRWGKSEMEKTRKDCFDRAAVLAAGKGEKAPETMNEVNDLLLRYAGPADSPEEMFTRAAGYLKRTRALAHSIVPLPEEEICDLMPTPWKLRESFPWGGYSDGDIEERPAHGGMFLNQYNYRAVTDGWMKMNCLHEAYPGHHVQYVRTISDPIPETMKIGAKSIAIMEGMAHRTERVYENLYAEDPFFPLFVSYRRHHTAVRIQADLMLYYYGRPIAEVVKLYEKELGFDEKTARGQVRAQENMPGYFTAYYYGMKTICDWEQEFGYERDDYTRLLFSLSNVSLETFRKVLELTPEQREDFFHGFRSLYMDAPDYEEVIVQKQGSEYR